MRIRSSKFYIPSVILSLLLMRLRLRHSFPLFYDHALCNLQTFFFKKKNTFPKLSF
ncbi:hypothetical protein E1A91_D04G169800v1 [Gossypium mustelinum]|uniref:Uncharacterized protein n=1 Tax=Gossypium mustelinum TaxID=34275 RepID=A0A5D2VEY8_GOSMU|nr:hypothetical protein E1A91_D04G169800v1 [Gossypium mustelinum]